MPLAEDQHLVGQLRPGGEHKPFRMSIRARTSRRDLHGLDTGAGQGRAGRCGELPGLVADQEPEARSPITEIHQEITDLLGGLRPVGVRGDPGNVHVAGAVYRFRTRRRGCDLRFGRITMLGQDGGLCLFACST